MKQFTTIKVGYTAGIYGCSNEYFTTIIINGSKHTSISHYGMYGSEERVNHALMDRGYREFYTPSDFGRMIAKDVNKNLFTSEHDVIKFRIPKLSSMFVN
jgi:hypothetical protein